jgi:hypothetical protein
MVPEKADEDINHNTMELNKADNPVNMVKHMVRIGIFISYSKYI